MHELKWPHQKSPTDSASMVDAQVGSWIVRQPGRQAVLQESPVVTIAGDFDDQVTTLGRGIAERLGFSYCDHGTVSELVRLTYVGQDAEGGSGSLNDHVLEDLLGTFSPELDGPSAGFTERARQIVCSIAHQGSAVIVGNEASFLVDPRRALRVRLVAPPNIRKKESATRTRVSLALANRSLVCHEMERAAFVRHALGQNIADPSHYDVVVNTSTYAQKRAEAVVLMAYLAKFGEWPLTAHALKGEPPDITEQQPSIAPPTDRAY